MGEEGGKTATEKGGFCSKTRSKHADAKEAKTEVGPFNKAGADPTAKRVSPGCPAELEVRC